MQLNYEGVTVQGVRITSQGGTENVLNTFWQQSDIDLSRGMDFQPRGAVFVRFTHLQHQAFTYNVTVNNSGPQRQGTCRIFIAPAQDERNNPWLFRDQKNTFIELDKFTVNCKTLLIFFFLKILSLLFQCDLVKTRFNASRRIPV